MSVADNLVNGLATRPGFVADVAHFAIFSRRKDYLS
jgi:hypothetical protein